VRVEGVEYHCLLDSGSVQTIVLLALVRGMKLQSVDTVMRTASGEPLAIAGEVEVGFEVGGKEIKVRAMVSPSTIEIIMGMDLLRSAKVNWQFEKDDRKIQVQGKRFLNFSPKNPKYPVLCYMQHQFAHSILSHVKL